MHQMLHLFSRGTGISNIRSLATMVVVALAAAPKHLVSAKSSRRLNVL
jgi:hypothetical protein